MCIRDRYKTACYTLLNTTKVNNTLLQINKPDKPLHYKMTIPTVGLKVKDRYCLLYTSRCV